MWLHAISVGEVNSAVGLLKRLRERLPGVPLYVSVGTLAGRELADKRLAGLADGIFFAPLDFAWCVRGALRSIRPALTIVMETEIWPNLWRESRRCGARLLVVNSRISDPALPRYRRLSWFFRPVVEQADLILAQTAENVERYRGLGRRGPLRHGGNLKYDFRPGPMAADLRAWFAGQRGRRVWIAASTMPPVRPGDVDEDIAVLDAFQALALKFPDLLLVHVPRKPERFAEVHEELRRRGIACVRRSSLPDGPATPAALLLDTIGELAPLFEIADVVFMGGSLADRGGHNLLEPAYFRRPVIAGPNLGNFAEIARDFRAASAFAEIGEPGELAPAVAKLLDDPALCAELGARAGRLAIARTGATAEAADEAARLHAEGVFRRPLRCWEWPLVLLSWLWRAGAAWNRWNTSARRLPAPVVSIGGIGMGGAGKTPFAVAVASLLKEDGLRPAFLTRGYGRRSSGSLVFAAGEPPGPLDTGDEARILLRSGAGPVGIGADRFEPGMLVWSRFQPAVFVLDDGFQHWRLARDLDIVLVDALDPFALGRVFPAGLLREPLDALARADVFVISRARKGRSYSGIERELRRVNPGAPVFRAFTEAAGWVDAATGEPSPGLSGPVFAFCGLGNPASFRETLRDLGADLREFREFRDHHRYSPGEIAELREAARSSGAVALVTTEKDAANLPEVLGDGLPVRWLGIRTQIERAELFRSLLRQKLTPDSGGGR